MAKTRLFKPVAPTVKKGDRFEIRANAADAAAIRELAASRHLSVSDFLRRAALGRRAAVDIQTDLVLAMIDSTRAVREYHAALIAHGFVPPENVLIIPIMAAAEAMARIDGKSGRAPEEMLDWLQS